MRTSRRHRLHVLTALALVAVVALPLSGCGSGSDGSSKTITVAGSTTVLPIAEIAAEKYEAKTGNQVLVSGLG